MHFNKLLYSLYWIVNVNTSGKNGSIMTIKDFQIMFLNFGEKKNDVMLNYLPALVISSQ